MDFYENLSSYYDEVFAVTSSEMAFINQRLPGRGDILDVGCGTGNKTELLAAPGRRLIGLDLDQDMIARARQKHAAPGVTYQTGDMARLGELFPEQSFDALLCLGNTLVHLVQPGQVAAFFNNAAALLRPGGLMALQVLNYDHLWAAEVTELPLITAGPVTFRRHYDWRSRESLSFKGRLEIDGQVTESAVDLRPVYRAELEEAAAGNFATIEFFGGFDGRPWAADSFVSLCFFYR